MEIRSQRGTRRRDLPRKAASLQVAKENAISRAQIARSVVNSLGGFKTMRTVVEVY